MRSRKPEGAENGVSVMLPCYKSPTRKVGVKFIPTDQEREIVQQMAMAGGTQEQISGVLDIDLKTLRENFRAELDTATVLTNGSVAGALYKNAMGGNVIAQIFWMKTRARWREADRENDAGNITVIIEGGGSVQIGARREEPEPIDCDYHTVTVQLPQGSSTEAE